MPFPSLQRQRESCHEASEPRTPPNLVPRHTAVPHRNGEKCAGAAVPRLTLATLATLLSLGLRLTV